MAQLTNRGGGDHHSKQAKVDIAGRGEQIVALRLRHHSFAAIGRTVGISKQAAQRAFQKALHRNTDKTIQTHHRSELAELEMEQSRLWQTLDQEKDNWKAVVSCLNAINRIHIRRARLLGLDAPQKKLDIQGLYLSGGDEMSAVRMERQAAYESLSLEDQAKLFELHERMSMNAIKPAISVLEAPARGSDSGGTNPDTESERERDPGGRR
jgi:hypothetical protein